MDWIHLAMDRDKWWAVVNTVMNLRFHYTRENSRISWGTNGRIFTVEQATNEQRGSRGIALPFL